MKHEELTASILAACFEVGNELGPGFLESVYHQALLLALRERALCVRSQVPLQVRFRGHVVGNFVADIVVEDRVIVEVKAVKDLMPEHQAQLINYLNATGVEIGMLVNFGASRVEYRRCERRARGR